MLGEEFTTLVASVDWKAESTTMPFLRVALCAAQVTAPKAFIKDGISKMITKNDFDKMKQKKQLAELIKAEKLMKTAWDTLEQSQLPLQKTALTFGKFQIRLVLLLLQKEQKGREGKEYKTMEAINEQFLEDFQKCSSQGSAPAAGPSESPTAVKSLDQVNDPVQIALAANTHIKVGKHYILREDADGKVWKLDGLTATSAKFSHVPYFAPPEEKELAHSDLKKIKLWTKDPPCLIANNVRQALMPAGSSTFIEEMARAKAQYALYDKYTQHLGSVQWQWVA